MGSVTSETVFVKCVSLTRLFRREPVTRTDCQRSVDHDTLVKIVDIEPKSKAMAMTFRGQPTARFIRAPRFEIPFFTISSEKFEKTEQELLAYEMPITKIIEENSVKDIQSIEDRQFLVYVEAAVQGLQLDANGGPRRRRRRRLSRPGRPRASRW